MSTTSAHPPNPSQILKGAAASDVINATPEQVVAARDVNGGSRAIYIAPSNPERTYVPRYDSSTVFDAFLPSALVFAAGLLAGSGVQ